jgi:predicted dehydrogenase
MAPVGSELSRRTFIGGTTALVGGRVALARAARGLDEIRLGLVGCGRRGTGAAAQALAADPGTRLVAMADAFADQLADSLVALARVPEVAGRVAVDEAQRFVGFDAYLGVLAADVDVVLLATPPHFRPLHLAAAIRAGKHVFAEKPAAVDAPGVRSVLASAALAREKGLSLLAGLNLRYLPGLQEAVARVRAGAIGTITALHAVRYGGEAWLRPRTSGMSEMEYQLRNWNYFTWLSGDFIAEQFVHQLDQAAWLLDDRYPVRCYGTGGRAARTGPEYGHVYDHFTAVYEYRDGTRLFATTRQQAGCTDELATYAWGTRGTFAHTSRGVRIEGEDAWRPERELPQELHQDEQDAFFRALRAGRAIDDGEHLARSTMMAILGRMCAYTGRSLTWEQALASREELKPSAYSFDAAPPEAEVAVPGVTAFF